MVSVSRFGVIRMLPVPALPCGAARTRCPKNSAGPLLRARQQGSEFAIASIVFSVCHVPKEVLPSPFCALSFYQES
jgi:hypothetical protein